MTSGIDAEPLPGSLPQAVFPWRRVLIAVWLSAAAHVAILAFIRVSPASAPHRTATLQVRLERTEAAKLPVPSPASPLPANRPTPPAAPRTPASTPAPPPRIAEPEASKMPHLDLPQLADTTYYEALALDVQPQVVSAIVLTDPEADSPSPHVGYVRLQLKLEADGRVSEAKVLESILPPAYETLAVEAFGKASFTPGRRDGRAVRARIVIEVDFKPPQTKSR